MMLITTTDHHARYSPCTEKYGHHRILIFMNIANPRQFRASEQLLRDSSEDEVDESTIHRAFDKMFGNNDGFPFVFSGRQLSTTRYHPPTIHIFQLWQIYIDNINPLLKITHIPSIQGQIIQASSNLENAPKNIEALMFGIYAMALTSLDDAEVEKMYNRSKKDILGQFFEGLQQALVNAGFMRGNDFVSLQAYVLYLVRYTTHPTHSSLINLHSTPMLTSQARHSMVCRSPPSLLPHRYSCPHRAENGLAPRPSRLRPATL